MSFKPAKSEKDINPKLNSLVNGIKSTVKNESFFKWDRLRQYNLILFVIHVIIIVFLIIYFSKLQRSSQKINYVNLDLFEHAFVLNDSKTFFDVVSEKVSSVSESGITSLIITFFAITAGFHLLYALNPNNIYLNAVHSGNNFLRWIEYSASATIMIVIIALLSGVKDVGNYIMLVVASIAIMSTGQWFETATGKSKWIPILVGFVLMGGVFLTIYTSFKQRLQESESFGFKVPKWLYLVVFIMFGFYASFGFVPVAQMIFKGNYRKYEYVYLTLSLLSKATLGILVAIGFSQRLSADNPS